MGSFSIWHLMFAFLAIFLIGYPVSIIMKKAGFSGWWALISVVPLINIIAIWFFAFSKWPNLNKI